MTRAWMLAAAAIAIWPHLAAAQAPAGDTPGPWAVDVRGVTAGLPTEAPFYPAAGTAIAVPSRGGGFEAGAHVYPFRLGPAQVGLGAAFMRVRSTSPDASATLRLIAPQISFNFGSGNGWSHLSAGFGTARIETAIAGQPLTADSGSLGAINAGGGARWFLTNRLAVGFDVRFHRVSAGKPRGTAPGTPRVVLMTAAIGVSLR